MYKYLNVLLKDDRISFAERKCDKKAYNRKNYKIKLWLCLFPLLYTNPPKKFTKNRNRLFRNHTNSRHPSSIQTTPTSLISHPVSRKKVSIWNESTKWADTSMTSAQVQFTRMADHVVDQMLAYQVIISTKTLKSMSISKIVSCNRSWAWT